MTIEMSIEVEKGYWNKFWSREGLL